MILKIDVRETTLIDLCRHKLSLDIQLITQQLPIGDVIICNDEQTIEYLIIERKTLSDLSSSIRDGRYEEQSYRLNGLNHHNHNIIYLIEGELNGFVAKSSKHKIDPNMIYSAMFSINYYKGFSVMRSKSLEESANIICNMCSKLKRDVAKKRQPYYSILSKTPNQKKENVEQNNESTEENDGQNNKQNNEPIEENVEENELSTSKNYCNVIKKNKKENITKNNIGEIMLCQIPGVSSTIALAVMKEFKTLPNLIESIKTDNNCINNIKTVDPNGKERKISKKTISTIIEYLQS